MFLFFLRGRGLQVGHVILNFPQNSIIHHCPVYQVLLVSCADIPLANFNSVLLPKSQIEVQSYTFLCALEHILRKWETLFVYKNMPSSQSYTTGCWIFHFIFKHSYELCPVLLYTVQYCQFLKITNVKIFPDRRNISDINWLNTLSAVHVSSFPKLDKNFHEKRTLSDTASRELSSLSQSFNVITAL